MKALASLRTLKPLLWRWPCWSAQVHRETQGEIPADVIAVDLTVVEQWRRQNAADGDLGSKG
jgi:hypothetical protein